MGSGENNLQIKTILFATYRKLNRQRQHIPSILNLFKILFKSNASIKPKKIYFTYIKGTNIRNIFPVLMFQQFLANKHHRLRDAERGEMYRQQHTSQFQSVGCVSLTA